jgi:hypothetical protein
VRRVLTCKGEEENENEKEMNRERAEGRDKQPKEQSKEG